MDRIVIPQNTFLFLPGIFLSDIVVVDQIFTDKILEQMDNTDDQTIEMIIYKANPTKFTTRERWPKSSNCKCWNCDNLFTTTPWFVPQDYYVNTKGEDEMTTIGNFCSEFCAQKYIDDKFKKDNTYRSKVSMMNVLYQKMTGGKIEKIYPALDRTIMKQYCGEDGISQEDYIKRVKQNSENLKLSGYKISDYHPK